MMIKGKKKKKSKKRIKIEFSKLVMAGMMSTYFVGLVFGIWAIIKLFNYSTKNKIKIKEGLLIKALPLSN